MEDKPIFIYCDCCGAEVEIHPTHAKYHQLKFEILRELHPEVADDEPLPERRVHEMCEHLSPKQAEENLRKHFIAPDPEC